VINIKGVKNKEKVEVEVKLKKSSILKEKRKIILHLLYQAQLPHVKGINKEDNKKKIKNTGKKKNFKGKSKGEMTNGN